MGWHGYRNRSFATSSLTEALRLRCARWSLLWAVPPCRPYPCEMMILLRSLPTSYDLGAAVLVGGLRGAPLRCVCLQWQRGASRKPPSSIIAPRLGSLLSCRDMRFSIWHWPYSFCWASRRDSSVECRSAWLGLFVFEIYFQSLGPGLFHVI
jgi:hypothetical protein